MDKASNLHEFATATDKSRQLETTCRQLEEKCQQLQLLMEVARLNADEVHKVCGVCHMNALQCVAARSSALQLL